METFLLALEPRIGALFIFEKVMEPLKTVLFIDGRNLKYNLWAFKFEAPVEAREGEIKIYSLDEKHFIWNKFFQGVIKKFDDRLEVEHRLIRVYWYNAANIRPFETRPKLAEAIVEEYSEKFPDLTVPKVLDLAKKWYEKEHDHFQYAKDHIHEPIKRNTSFVEFKYVGDYVVHPYTVKKLDKDEEGNFIYAGERFGEKGVDVGIATDMIAKMPYYEVAVLVSGDADFIPAVCYLKEHLKQVYQFSLSQGVPPEIRYLSPWLIGVVDVFHSFNEFELLNDYLDIDNRTIPTPIKRVIKARIKELDGKFK